MKLQKTMKKEYLLIIISMILFMSFVSAVPPITTVQQFTEGYLIEDNPQNILTQNQDYQVNFFVYNISNGNIITPSSATCYFYLANSSGNVLIFSNVTYSADEHWGVDIAGGNFSSIGYYGYGIKCQDTNIGGAIAGLFEVTATGQETFPETMVVSAGLFLLIFGVSIFFLILFLKIESPPIKLFFLMLSFVFLIGSLLMAMVVGYNSGLPANINSAITNFMYALGLVFTLIFMFVLIKQITSALDMMREKKGYEVGI